VQSEAKPVEFRYETARVQCKAVAPMTNALTSKWNKTLSWRTAYLVLSIVIATLVSWSVLVAVCKNALHDDQQSHILLILPVSLALLYSERRNMLRRAQYSVPAGIILVMLVALSVWIDRYPSLLSQNDSLSLHMALLVASWITAFLAAYDVSASRTARFPLLFLFLMVPIPDFVLDWTTWLLQKGSAETAFLLLKAANVPVQRQGWVLGLPGIDIEVARECSGIHSALVLFIVSLVLGHLFLQSSGRKILLVTLAGLIAVAKNGLRIFALSVLKVYVDPLALNGELHRQGGILFFLLGLGILMLIVRWLRKGERGPRELHNPNTAESLAFAKEGT
jgi:exosortase